MTSTADPLNVWEHAARAFELRAPDPVREQADEDSWRTPGTLAKRLVPETRQTPGLDLIDQALMDLVETPGSRLIITMPPQEGKSTRVAKDFVLWALKNRPWLRVVGASYGQTLANRNGRSIRNTIKSNPDLGLTLAADNGSASEWQLDGHRGGLVSVGIGAGLTGRPADLMVIDDPIKDQKEADSTVFRDNVWDWWQTVASTRLGPGAQVVVILTRWHDDDLAGRLLAQDDSDWTVLNIPAEADHDPNDGETDVLGRQPGEFMQSARGWTTEQWKRRKREAGSRRWDALYQGRPTSASGTIFQRKWWREYEQPLWLEREDSTKIVTGFDNLLVSWDLTFKNTAGADYVSGQVWGRIGTDCYLLDRVHARMDFVETCKAVRQLAATWPQALWHVVEDKANGPAVMAALRGVVPGLVPEEPQGGKVARASAVAPLVEAGNVFLPSPKIAAWVGEVIEECAAFPTGKNDDDVDSLTQALNRLILQPLLAGEQLGNGSGIVTHGDLDAEIAGFGAYIP